MLMLINGTAGCKNDPGTATKQTGQTDQTSQTGNKTKLVVGTSASYNPWAFQEKDEVKGFEIDIWKEIANRNNYELEI